MADPIRVAVIGAKGRMGRETVKAVAGDPRMVLVGAIGRSEAGKPLTSLLPGIAGLEGMVLESDLLTVLEREKPDVLVDLSHHSVVEGNALLALKHHCSPIIGTTGMTPETLQAIGAASDKAGIGALFVPNFAIGAVLMMRFSQLASRWFPDAEIIEMHHERKEDAPSGTALLTAKLIGEARTGTATPKPTPVVKAEGALGGIVHGVPVHSVRLPGLLAHQQVMFGAPGETLTIRHDSTDRAGFMHGVKLCIREVRGLTGLVVGLDQLLFRAEV